MAPYVMSAGSKGERSVMRTTRAVQYRQALIKPISSRNLCNEIAGTIEVYRHRLAGEVSLPGSGSQTSRGLEFRCGPVPFSSN